MNSGCFDCRRSFPGAFSILLMGLVLAGSACAPKPAASYEKEIKQWRQGREQSLRGPDSWLTLVGLSWLDEGENPVGSGPDNKVQLPAGKAPEHVGTIHVRENAVTLDVGPGVAVTHAGKPVERMELETDAGGEPTVLELGTLRFYVIERTGRLGVRVRDTESEALLAFDGLDYYPIDPEWRVEARFQPHESPTEVEIPNVMGTMFRVAPPGVLILETGGETYRLDVMPNGPSYLLVFGDETNGAETYGGGRFLSVDLPAEAGPVTLDFNKAYNPPCVFTPYATCPLPPPQNRLAVAVRAGEKGYTHVGH